MKDTDLFDAVTKIDESLVEGCLSRQRKKSYRVRKYLICGFVALFVVAISIVTAAALIPGGKTTDETHPENKTVNFNDQNKYHSEDAKSVSANPFTAEPSGTPAESLTAYPSETPSPTLVTEATPETQPTLAPGEISDPDENFFGEFDPPIYSEYSKRYIDRRADNSGIGTKAFYETAVTGTVSQTVYMQIYFEKFGTTTVTTWDYDSEERMIERKELCPETGRSVVETYEYHDNGNTRRYTKESHNEDGTWVIEQETRYSDGRYQTFWQKESNGKYTYTEYIRLEEGGSETIQRNYDPNKAGDYRFCFARYTDKSGITTDWKLLCYDSETGEYYEEDYKDPSTPTPFIVTPDPAATPVPVTVPSFDPPADATEVTVSIDNSVEELYPSGIPNKIMISKDKAAYFSQVIEIVPDGLYLRNQANSNFEIYRLKGRLFVHLKYLGSCITDGNDIEISTDGIFMTLECTSSEDLAAIRRTVEYYVASTPTGQIDYGCLLDIIGDGLYYRYNNHDWNNAIIQVDTVKKLGLRLNSGGEGYVTMIQMQHAAPGYTTGPKFSYDYGTDRTLTEYVKEENSVRTERSYVKGVLKREFTQNGTQKTNEIIYGYEDADTYIRTVEKNKETVQKIYDGRSDLLYKVMIETDNGCSIPYNTTETLTYFKDESRIGTYVKKITTVRHLEGYNETTVKEYNTDSNLIKETRNGLAISYVIEKFYNGNVLTEEKGTEYHAYDDTWNYSLSRYNPAGIRIYNKSYCLETGRLDEIVMDDSGTKVLIHRTYEPDGMSDKPERLAKYYDNDGKLIKKLTITYVNGEWIES